MISSIELQIISRILTSQNEAEVDTLCGFDASYYNIFKKEIGFILSHRAKYGDIPDSFTFQSEFPDFELVAVSEPLEFLVSEIKKNKQHIILIETFNKIKDLGSGDVSEAWQYLSNQCERANNLNDSRPMDIIKDAKLRADQIIAFNKAQRIPTGFDEIDKLMYGGLSTVEELLLIVARTNTGKAQPLWSRVLTPTGWVTMKDIRVGDVVCGKNNDNGRVVRIFPQGRKKYYRVHFDDDTFTECCGDHLWEVLDSDRRDRSNKQYGVHYVETTDAIRGSIAKRYSVDMCGQLEFNSDFNRDCELDGYLLGVILGDGSTRDGCVSICNENRELWTRIESSLSVYDCHRSAKSKDYIVGCNGNNFVRNKIVEYGLMNVKSADKFIPEKYFFAPVDVRMDLLAGLVDTDGYSPKETTSVWEFDTSSEQLAKDFARLARSLGVKVKIHDRKPSYYKTGDTKHIANGSRHLVCRSDFNPFYVSSKASRFSIRTTPLNGAMPKRLCKMIQSVEYIGETECQCILLDNETHTYITDDFVVTHNTWVTTKMMESAQSHGFPVLYYSPEMQSSFMGTRFDTWRRNFINSDLHRGRYSEEYLKYIDELSHEGTSAYILEDKDTPEGAVTVSVLQQLVKQLHIKLLIIDGLSYMKDEMNAPRDDIKYKNLCTGLFRLSKQFGCAVVITMQANRETKEEKDDKGVARPTLYNVEGSDHPARICTQAFCLRQIFDRHILEIGLEKSRTAANTKPVFTYSWDPGSGQMSLAPADDSSTPTAAPPVHMPSISGFGSDASTSSTTDAPFATEDDDDVEF